MSKASEIQKKIDKTAKKYSGMRSVKVNGQSNTTMLSRQQIGSKRYQDRRKKAIKKTYQHNAKGKQVRIHESRALLILEKLRVNSRDELEKVIPKLVEKQIVAYFKKHVTPAKSLLTKNPTYNWEDDPDGMLEVFWGEFMLGLKKLRAFRDNDIDMWFDDDPTLHHSNRLFPSGAMAAGVRGFSAAARDYDRKTSGKIQIYVNYKFPLERFIEDSKRNFHSEVTYLMGAIRHELTHRLQIDPIYNKSIFKNIFVIRKFRMWLLANAGSWFRRGSKKYYAMTIEQSAFANEVAHHIERGSDAWKEILVQFRFGGGKRSMKKLVKEVYVILKAAGLSDEQVREATKAAAKDPKGFAQLVMFGEKAA